MKKPESFWKKFLREDEKKAGKLVKVDPWAMADKMRIAVVSDTHEEWQAMQAGIEVEGVFDHLIFLGDIAKDGRQLAEGLHLSATIVKGNCDATDVAPLEKVVIFAGVKILISHGHYYQVKEDLEMIRDRGEALAVDLILFGHTHHELYEEGTITLINPGAGGRSKFIKNDCTWGILTLERLQGADQRKNIKYEKKVLPI